MSFAMTTLENLDSLGAIARLATECNVCIDILVRPTEDGGEVILSIGDNLEMKARRGTTESVIHTYES
jgi:hypothetical protein